MQTSVIKITPAKAKLYLAQNKGNRPLQKLHVNFLASEIEKGNWKCNGESIKIGKDKQIIDGQHRLTAVVKANKSITTALMTGLDPAVFDTIDTGKNRSPGDTYALMGEKNAKPLAVLIKNLHRYYMNDWKKQQRISNSEFEKLLTRWPDARTIVNNYALKAPGLLNLRIIHFCYYVFKKKNKDQASDFMTKLCHGNDIAARSPIMAVRNKIMEGRLKGMRMDPDAVITLIFKAWNMYREGKTTTRMTYKKGEVLQKAR